MKGRGGVVVWREGMQRVEGSVVCRAIEWPGRARPIGARQCGRWLPQAPAPAKNRRPFTRCPNVSSSPLRGTSHTTMHIVLHSM